MPHPATRAARILAGALLIAVATLPPTSVRAQQAPLLPNYDLAAQWTSQKVSKLVFDTSVTPRWLELSDRFWYAYQTREGRKFVFVDPVKRTKAPLFDHAKLAAVLTSITRLPYDAQHLPFSTVRFVKKDTAFEFDVQVPAEASINVSPKRETTEQNSVQSVKAAVRQILVDNLVAEERLDADARKLLLDHAKAIRDSAADYRQLLGKVKEKMARERGFIL